MIRWCGTDWGGEPADEHCVAMAGGEPLVVVEVEVVPDEDAVEDECPGR